MDLADRLAQARKAKGLSQRKLSKAAGLSGSYVSLIENRQRTNIGLNTLTALGRVLGVDAVWLGDGIIGQGPYDEPDTFPVRQATLEEAHEEWRRLVEEEELFDAHLKHQQDVDARRSRSTRQSDTDNLLTARNYRLFAYRRQREVCRALLEGRTDLDSFFLRGELNDLKREREAIYTDKNLRAIIDEAIEVLGQAIEDIEAASAKK